MSDSPVNIRVVLEKFENDVEFLQELFQIYLDSARGQMESLTKAVTVLDIGGARDHAHVLRGASANVGAEKMSECAATLEEACIADDGAGVQAAYSVLNKEYARTRSFLEEYIKNPK